MDPIEIKAIELLQHANSDSAPEDLRALRGWSYANRLWKGGMGAVALVRKQDNSVFAALKFLLPAVALMSKTRELFFREVTNMKALHHPNVVALLDAGSDGDTVFLLMEYCDRGSVSDLMQQSGGTLPLDKALNVTFEVLDALEYAHNAVIPNVRLANGTYGVGRGLVHRDIKPLNMLLRSHNASVITKLADYGLAKAFNLAGLSDMTRAGSYGGTAPFMPRQQVEEYLFAKPEVDIWAVAASLYCMLTGYTPRDFSIDSDALTVILHTAPVPISQRGAAIPPRIAELLDSALNDQTNLLFQDVPHFRNALRTGTE